MAVCHFQDRLLREEALHVGAACGCEGYCLTGSAGYLRPASLAALQAVLLGRLLERLVHESAFYRRKLALCQNELDALAGACHAVCVQMREGTFAGGDDFALTSPLRSCLAGLPLTDSSELRTSSAQFLCGSRDDVARVVSLATSGSTGLRKRLAFTRDDLERTRCFFAAGMAQIVGPGQRLLVCLPGAERPGGVADLLNRGLSPRGILVSALPSLAGDEDFLASVRTLRPQSLVLSPRQLHVLWETFDRAPEGLVSMLVSSDWCNPQLEKSVREAWGIECIDHYGITESCFGCALECLAHDGYHIRHLDLLCEIVDPVSGEVLPPGEVGELVFTTLRHGVMPLLRYRTGDATSFLTGPCRCGSPYSRLGPMLGRFEKGSRSIVHVRKAERCHVPAGESPF